MIHTDEIKALREQIAALKHEQREVTDQMRSRAEVKAYVERAVALAERQAAHDARRALQGLAYGNADVMHADVTDARQSAPAQVDLGPTLVAMLGAKKVLSVLLVDLDTVPEGLPAAQRATRLEQITAELYELETREEALICEAEEAGEIIPRRRDADPAIVLALRAEDAAVERFSAPRIPVPQHISVPIPPRFN